MKTKFRDVVRKYKGDLGNEVIVALAVELDAVEERLEAVEIAIRALQDNERSGK